MWTQIELGMKDHVENIRLKSKRSSSSHDFASLFIWAVEMQLSLWLEPDGFMVRQGCRGANHYFFPCGSRECKLRMLDALPPGAIMHYANAADVAFAAQWKPSGCPAQAARDDWEYLYNRQAQVELPGKLYSHLRWTINRVRRLPGWQVRPLNCQTLPMARELEAQYQASHSDDTSEGVQIAAKMALEHFHDLALVGVLAFLGEKPVGYVSGKLLNESTFFGVTLRTTDPVFFAPLRWELLNALPNEVQIINMEEDLGLEGLRQNKMSLNPDGFYEMFDIQL